MTDRDLDALVAEKVMEWHLFTSSGKTWACTSPFCKTHDRTVQGPGDRLMFAGETFGFFPAGWSPSTDIAAAWQVMEHLANVDLPSGHSRDFAVSVSSYADAKYHAVFGGDYLDQYGNTRSFEHEARANTAPHAICLAALRAVGVEVSDD